MVWGGGSHLEKGVPRKTGKRGKKKNIEKKLTLAGSKRKAIKNWGKFPREGGRSRYGDRRLFDECIIRFKINLPLPRQKYFPLSAGWGMNERDAKLKEPVTAVRRFRWS